jgi:hypothetical protein
MFFPRSFPSNGSTRLNTLNKIFQWENVSWDITSCRPLIVNRHFEETCHFHLRGQRIRKKRRQLKLCLSSEFKLLSCYVYSSTLKMVVKSFSKSRLTFNKLHGITSQNTEPVIARAVGTSVPIKFNRYINKTWLVLCDVTNWKYFLPQRLAS